MPFSYYHWWGSEQSNCQFKTGKIRSARCVGLWCHPARENDSRWLILFWGWFTLPCSCNGKRIKIKILRPILASAWEVNPIVLAKFQLRSPHSAGGSRLVQFQWRELCFASFSAQCAVNWTAVPSPPWRGDRQFCCGITMTLSPYRSGRSDWSETRKLTWSKDKAWEVHVIESQIPCIRGFSGII